jgi:hypothetical protein
VTRNGASVTRNGGRFCKQTPPSKCAENGGFIEFCSGQNQDRTADAHQGGQLSIPIRAEKATGALRVTYGHWDDAKVIEPQILLNADTQRGRRVLTP